MSRKVTTFSSTVRIQAEVMLLLVVVEATVRRIFAVATSAMLRASDGRGAPSRVLLNGGGASLLECGTTIALMVWVLERRFSPGTNIQAWFRFRCSGRVKLQNNLQKETDQQARRVALLLGSLAASGVTVGVFIGTASLCNFLSLESFQSRSVEPVRAAAASMIRDPVLEEVLYRGVIFDGLVGRDHGAASAGVVLEAAWTSSLFFGGVHLAVHLLRDGIQASWSDRHFLFYQVILAIGMGYVYCVLYFLAGGRLLPTIFLHSANNVAASFYYALDGDTRNSSLPGGTSTQPPQGREPVLTDCSADGSGADRITSALTPDPWCWQSLAVARCGAGATEALAAPWKMHIAFLAMAVAYCMAGRTCSNRLRELNSWAGVDGERDPCSDTRPNA